MWCLKEALSSWEEGGSSQNRHSQSQCPSISISTVMAVPGVSQGSPHTLQHPTRPGLLCPGWRIAQRNINGSTEPCSRHHLESLCMPCSLDAKGLASWQGAKELRMDTSISNVHAHFHAVSRFFWQSSVPAAPWVLQSTAPAIPAPIQPPEQDEINPTHRTMPTKAC